MRHRMIDLTGLGNPEPCKLDNNITITKEKFWNRFLADCIGNFKTIEEHSGFDLHLSETGFYFGIEPTYQYDDKQIIYIDFSSKGSCSIEQGRAFGPYGSQCLSKIKAYRDYKLNSKFIRFIDKWYSPLLEKLKEYRVSSSK